MFSQVNKTCSNIYMSVSGGVICRHQGPFYLQGLTLIPAQISNYIHHELWDGITSPFLNFNRATI